jgi:hypothetical protein
MQSIFAHGLAQHSDVSSNGPVQGAPLRTASSLILRKRVWRPGPHVVLQSVHICHSAKSQGMGSLVSPQGVVAFKFPSQGLPPLAACCVMVRTLDRCPHDSVQAVHASHCESRQSTFVNSHSSLK